ncbi:MAG TPA: hypothetical protein PKD77_11125 [Rudaea sp.]|jgi:hypothetical protein|nr:hypothetical protein [Rudaea sp.]
MTLSKTLGIVSLALFLLFVAGAFFLRKAGAPTPPSPATTKQASILAPPKESPVHNPSPALRPISMVEADGTVLVPRQYQLPGVEKVRTAKNFKDWIAQFPASDQKFIVDFDKSHFNVYSTITSPQQVAWMAQHGYPMPEDILAAKNISDEELEKLAASGNDKAGFLLYERQAATVRTEIDAYIAGGGKESELPRSDTTLAAEQSKVNSALNALYRSSSSPYKGYAMAQEASMRSDADTRNAGIIAGLLWAGEYGDTRAIWDSLHNFTQGKPELESQAIAAMKMLNALDMDRSRLNCYPVPPVAGWMIPAKVWQ